MKKLILFSLFFTLILSNLTFSYDIMPVSEIKSGMKGYGVTIAKGNLMVKFDVEIIDVLKNISPKRSVILAKFTGKDIELSGIAQGMSGSPIYINDKLVGALAYTWEFLKESIGGIQPIEEMLPVLKENPKKDLEPFKFVLLDEKSAKENNSDVFSTQYSQNKTLKPISTPLMLSGFNSEVYDFFKEKYEKLGFSVIQGSGGSEKIDENSKELNPGDAVGVQMVRGDLNITAVGTVTYREGNRVLIFGHPFLERGLIDMPMTRAFVHYIMPSLKVSWKFASVSNVVGSVYQDRDTALAGELGRKSPMIPIQLNLETDHNQYQFKYEMTSDPLFFPNSFAGVVMNSVLSKDSKMSEGSAECEFKVNIIRSSGKKEELILKDFFIGTNAETVYQAVAKVIAPLQYLMYNWFEPIKIESIDIKIRKKQNYYAAVIDKAIILNQQIKAGDTLKLRVFLRLYKGGMVDENIEIDIPKNLETDMLIVWICSSKLEAGSAIQQYAPKFAPKNFEQMMSLLKMNSSYNDLTIWFDAPQNSAVVDGYFLPNLPISKLFNYAYRERGNAFIGGRRLIKTLSTQYLIAGFIAVPIRISK